MVAVYWLVSLVKPFVRFATVDIQEKRLTPDWRSFVKKYKLENLDCASCAANIEQALLAMDGVKSCSVNFASSTLMIEAEKSIKVGTIIKEIEPEVKIHEYSNDTTPAEKLSSIWSELVEKKWEIIRISIVSGLLTVGVVFTQRLHNTPYELAELFVYISAYMISGWKVIVRAGKNIFRGRVFDENFLMTVATLGAFAIHEMPEAVAVMLFYVVGELIQDLALGRSRRSIKSLLEVRPDFANLMVEGGLQKVSPDKVEPGMMIAIRPGERIPLDGTVIEGSSLVDTSALTGEPVPRMTKSGDAVLAGTINMSALLKVTTTKRFKESSISRILELVENAASKKAASEKFITTFARYYTPAIVASALLIAGIPPMLMSGQNFTEWIYRALVVLVISCPCALVISIPLGYFGGIGSASRKGVLVKGSNYLDTLTKVNTVVFDKTGTLTKGEFKVSTVITRNGFTSDEILSIAAHAESHSGHPIAKSILDAYDKKIDQTLIESIEEIGGKGIQAQIGGKQIIIGNDRMLHSERIQHDTCVVEGTVVHVAINSVYAGYIVISDSLKPDAVGTIRKLKELNISCIMLTGDNKTSAELFAKRVGIENYYSDLLPEHKVEHIERLITNSKNGAKVAFVGDGINDAPVLARADVGIAMGAFGSDAAVETADIVLMSDSPLKVVAAIEVAIKTRKIVWQNIAFAMGVKLVFVLLGMFGMAKMWEAVFADMGVALLAIFNAIRILK